MSCDYCKPDTTLPCVVCGSKDLVYEVKRLKNENINLKYETKELRQFVATFIKEVDGHLDGKVHAGKGTPVVMTSMMWGKLEAMRSLLEEEKPS